jgi:hypothetical protein
MESNHKSHIKPLLPVLMMLVCLNSCVPLAIGAAGAAAGYIARDNGVGVVEPLDSSSSDQTHDSYEPAVY